MTLGTYFSHTTDFHQVSIPLEAMLDVGSLGQGRGTDTEPMLPYSSPAQLEETQPAIATPHSLLMPTEPRRVDWLY